MNIRPPAGDCDQAAGAASGLLPKRLRVAGAHRRSRSAPLDQAPCACHGCCGTGRGGVEAHLHPGPAWTSGAARAVLLRLLLRARREHRPGIVQRTRTSTPAAESRTERGPCTLRAPWPLADAPATRPRPASRWAHGGLAMTENNPRGHPRRAGQISGDCATRAADGLGAADRNISPWPSCRARRARGSRLGQSAAGRLRRAGEPK